MAKFVFKLDGVLRHRKHLEQEKQRQLALVHQQMRELEGQLQALNQSVQAANDDMRQNRLTGKLDLNFLAAHRRFMLATQRQALALAQKMAEVQRQILEAQKALAEAAKQRKVIEKLRERYLQRWQEDQSRREMAQLDEIGMQLAYQSSQQSSHDTGDGN